MFQSTKFITNPTSVFSLFSRIYKSNEKLEQFYSLLLKDSLERDDVSKLEEEKKIKKHVILQAFKNSSICHKSSLYCTVFQLIASICLAAGLSTYRNANGITQIMQECTVHKIGFLCVVPYSNFYWVSIKTTILYCGDQSLFHVTYNCFP